MNLSNWSMVDLNTTLYDGQLEFCGIVDAAVQAHYQNQLINQFWLFLLAGVVIGVLLAACYYFWVLYPRLEDKRK